MDVSTRQMIRLKFFVSVDWDCVIAGLSMFRSVNYNIDSKYMSSQFIPIYPNLKLLLDISYILLWKIFLFCGLQVSVKKSVIKFKLSKKSV